MDKRDSLKCRRLQDQRQADIRAKTRTASGTELLNNQEGLQERLKQRIKEAQKFNGPLDNEPDGNKKTSNPRLPDPLLHLPPAAGNKGHRGPGDSSGPTFGQRQSPDKDARRSPPAIKTLISLFSPLKPLIFRLNLATFSRRPTPIISKTNDEPP